MSCYFSLEIENQLWFPRILSSKIQRLRLWLQVWIWVLRFQVWIWDTDEVDFRNDEDVIRIQSTSTMEEFLRSGLIRTLSNIYVELIYQFAYLFIYRFLSTYIKFIFLTTTFTSIKRIDFAFFSFIEIFLR